MMKKEAPPREYLESETSVWWDMDKCPLPDGYDPWRVGPCIKSELGKLGYSGPITIFGVGNLKHLPERVLEALLSTGITLKHAPTRISQASMFTFMLIWKSKIQGPRTIMLISDSVGFDELYPSLSRLQVDDQCNILLAYKDALKHENYSLVTHQQWLWKSLLEDAKCGETVAFSCILCCFDTQSLKEVTEHLKSEAHLLEESLLQQAGATVDSSSPKRAVKKQRQRKFKKKKKKITYEHLPQQEQACL